MKNIKNIIEESKKGLMIESSELITAFTNFLKVNRVNLVVGPRRLFREVLQKKNVVAVLAITDEGRVLLCAQPRAGSNQLGSIEIPAGLIDEGESPEEAAKRELLEETGYEAKELIRLRGMFTDPACCNSYTTVFLAKGVEKVAEQNLDSDELLTKFDVSWEEYEKMVKDEIICDANSSVAYYAALEHLS